MRLNSSGFSLAGVLVAVGVGSIVVVGMMSVINNLQTGQNGVKFRTDADVINEEIRALLSSGPACAATFSGLTAAAGQSHQLTALKNGAGADLYVLGGKYGDRTLLLNELVFENFQPGATALNGTMTLNSNFGTAKESMGSQAVNRTVAISVDLDAAQKIVSCIALARMSDGIWQRSAANINNIYFTSPSPAGRVGIGTTDPTDLFHVVRNGAGQQSNMRLTSDNQSQIVLSSPNNFLYFHDPSAPLNQKHVRWASRGGRTQVDIMDDVPSTTPLRVPFAIQHSTGNIGIGTTNPVDHVMITDNFNAGRGLKVQNDSALPLAYSYLVANNDTGRAVNLMAFASGYAQTVLGLPGANMTGIYSNSVLAIGTIASQNLYFSTNDIPRMTIDTAGNVGVGTTSPARRFTVSEPAGTSVIRIESAAGSNAADLELVRIGSGVRWTLANYTDNALHFVKNDGLPSIVDALIITPAGNIGIGTANPLAALHVNNGEVRVEGGNSGYAMADRSNNGQKMIIQMNNDYMNFDDYGVAARMVIHRSTGNVGMGTANPSERLHVVGNLRVQGGGADCTLGNGAGGTSCSSDVRLKKNVEPVAEALLKILSLRGVEFDWNEKSQSPGRHDIGLIAQEVEKVFPTAVSEDPSTGFKKVDYAILVAPIIQAFGEVNGKLKRVEQENDELRGRLDRLEKSISSRQ